MSLPASCPVFSSETQPVIFLNNHEFKGGYIKTDDDFFLDARAVLLSMPEQGFVIDEQEGRLILKEKDARCIYNSQNKSSPWYVSGRKLAELIEGIYQYNKEAEILDIHIPPAKKKVFTVGFPMIQTNNFFGRDDQYSPPIKKVSGSMGKDLKMTVGILPVDVIFLDTAKVQVLGGPGALGFSSLEHRDGRLVSAKVYISSEKDEEETAYILAHELAHIWQDWKAPGSLVRNSKLVEGFAEWVAYKTCLNLGYDKAASKALENTAPAYRDGIRYYLDMEKRYGKDKVFLFIEGKFIP